MQLELMLMTNCMAQFHGAVPACIFNNAMPVSLAMAYQHRATCYSTANLMVDLPVVHCIFMLMCT